jgi:hypothetical protein
MKNSGLADSPFFAVSREKRATAPLPETTPIGIGLKPKQAVERRAIEPAAQRDTTTPRNHDTAKPRNHDTTVSRYHDTTIEAVRKVVKEFGKEAATHRFTVREKQVIAEIVYDYKGNGVRTSENEIARIAINWLINDYHQNRENSVLDLVLQALNS